GALSQWGDRPRLSPGAGCPGSGVLSTFARQKTTWLGEPGCVSNRVKRRQTAGRYEPEALVLKLRCCLSPNGAAVNSQGCQPLVHRGATSPEPQRGDSAWSLGRVTDAPLGLWGCAAAAEPQGLTPLAINRRPVGAQKAQLQKALARERFPSLSLRAR